MSVIIKEEEIKRIFFEKFLPVLEDGSGEIKLPIKDNVLRKAAVDGGFSSIYTFTDAAETEYVLKVLSTTRTEIDDVEPVGITEANTAAFNEILALRCLNEKNLDAVIMSDCFEYKPEASLYTSEQLEELKHEYIYFIIMPKYITFGEYFNTEKNSEKDIYDLSVSLLESLKGIHEPICFLDSYNFLNNNGIITFNNGYIHPEYIDNYKEERIILHKDIKKGNFLVTRRGKVLFSDFGAINLLNPDNSFNMFYPEFVTPEYCAPELSKIGLNGCNINSDIYSLGVTLKELLPQDKNGSLRKDLITQEFLDILDNMTEYDPDERYATEDDVLTELSEIKTLISDNPFPKEINEITRFKILLAERNINELYKEAQKLYNEDSEDAFNIRFYSYAKACHDGIKSKNDFEEAVKIIEPLIEKGDKVALCLPYVYYENMGDRLASREFNTLEKHNFIKMLKSSSDKGYIPAKYLYAKRVCRSPGLRGETVGEVVEMFDKLMENKFVPALRYYRKLLQNPGERGCVYERLNRYEREDRIEMINELLSEKKEESMACMFFDYLY